MQSLFHSIYILDQVELPAMRYIADRVWEKRQSCHFKIPQILSFRSLIDAIPSLENPDAER